MKLRPQELEFLAAWAHEEKAPDPYALPAHQQQAGHGVKGVALIRLTKAWARSKGRRDEDIFELPAYPSPPWPWPDPGQLTARLAEEAPPAPRATNA